MRFSNQIQFLLPTFIIQIESILVRNRHTIYETSFRYFQRRPCSVAMVPFECFPNLHHFLFVIFKICLKKSPVGHCDLSNKELCEGALLKCLVNYVGRVISLVEKHNGISGLWKPAEKKR